MWRRPEHYADRYAGAPFVRLMDGDTLPETRHVRGSNGCHLALRVAGDGKLLLVFAAIDNLMKGAAGQAIQVEPDVGLARRPDSRSWGGHAPEREHPRDSRPWVVKIGGRLCEERRGASDWRAPAPPSRPRSSSCMAAAAR